LYASAWPHPALPGDLLGHFQLSGTHGHRRRTRPAAPEEHQRAAAERGGETDGPQLLVHGIGFAEFRELAVLVVDERVQPDGHPGHEQRRSRPHQGFLRRALRRRRCRLRLRCGLGNALLQIAGERRRREADRQERYYTRPQDPHVSLLLHVSQGTFRYPLYLLTIGPWRRASAGAAGCRSSRRRTRSTCRALKPPTRTERCWSRSAGRQTRRISPGCSEP